MKGLYLTWHVLHNNLKTENTSQISRKIKSSPRINFKIEIIMNENQFANGAKTYTKSQRRYLFDINEAFNAIAVNNYLDKQYKHTELFTS